MSRRKRLCDVSSTEVGIPAQGKSAPAPRFRPEFAAAYVSRFSVLLNRALGPASAAALAVPDASSLPIIAPGTSAESKEASVVTEMPPRRRCRCQTRHQRRRPRYPKRIPERRPGKAPSRRCLYVLKLVSSVSPLLPVIWQLMPRSTHRRTADEQLATDVARGGRKHGSETGPILYWDRCRLWALGRVNQSHYGGRTKAQSGTFHIARPCAAAKLWQPGRGLGDAAMSSLKPSQSREARRLLKWSQYRLAAKANISETTVRVFENGSRVPSSKKLAALEVALESAGVEFDAGPPSNVQLRDRNVSKSGQNAPILLKKRWS
jgi:DNA-binding XRE family transcriptional regulator